MEVYKAEEFWVLGVKGGEYNGIKRDARAVILKQFPIPVIKISKLYAVDYENEQWEYELVYWKYAADNRLLHIVEVEYCRLGRSFLSGTFEYFITEKVSERILSVLTGEGTTRSVFDRNENKWVTVEET